MDRLLHSLPRLAYPRTTRVPDGKHTRHRGRHLLQSDRRNLLPLTRRNSTMTIIHYTGAGYYYATDKGVQLSKHYKTRAALRRFGRVTA